MTIDLAGIGALIGSPLQGVLLVVVLIYLWRLDRTVLTLTLRVNAMSVACPLFHSTKPRKDQS